MSQIVQLLILASSDPDQRIFIRTMRDEIAPWRLKRARPGAYDNFGEVRVDNDVTLHLFGVPDLLPGQDSAAPRFIQGHDTWDIMAAFTTGFVVIVACTRPTTFAEAQSMIGFFHGQRQIPFVVAATRFDAPGVVALPQIHTAMGLDESTKVVACDITQPESTKRVRLDLLYTILARMD